MNQETLQFITTNIDADIHQLSLQSSRFPLVDMSFAIRQINGKQKIKTKVPLFYSNDSILYPAQLSLEQSSSQSIAKYKASLCEGNNLVDLTGGFGIDCYFLSEHFQQVSYVEQQAELCNLALHNFNVLKRKNIQVIQADSVKYLSEMEKADWIYIDPARRSSSGKKVILLSDCEPNIITLYDSLLKKGNRIMIKLSPMMDISAAIHELPSTYEIHIVSLQNECKEIILLLGQIKPENIKITTINILKNNILQELSFYQNEELNAEVEYTSIPEKYLYEPNASIMKSGGFKTIANKFGLRKLHTNTHLYTSSQLVLEFPGRAFELVKTWDNTKNDLKELALHLPKANLSTRNYPLTVDELRKKLKIKDGGESYLFACTLENNKKVIIETRRI